MKGKKGEDEDGEDDDDNEEYFMQKPVDTAHLFFIKASSSS